MNNLKTLILYKNAAARKRRDAASLCFFVLLFAFVLGAAHAQSPRRLNNTGVAAYNNGKYDQAYQNFQKAQEAAPDNLMLTYNLGAAESATSKTADAMNAFKKVTGARDSALANRARFAEGVMQYNQSMQKIQQKDLQGALESAKAAAAANQAVLLSDPAEKDARVNYELASLLRKTIEKELQQQQQQKQNQQQQDKDQQNKDDKKQQQDQQQKDNQQQQPTPTPSPSPDQQQKKDDQQKQDKDQQDKDKKDQKDKQKEQGGATPTPTQSNEDQSKQQQQQQAASTPTPSPEQQKQAEAGQQKKQEAKEQDATTSILNVLDNNDNEALKRMLKQRYGNVVPPEKDW